MRKHILLIAVLLAVMSSSCAFICPKVIYPPLRGTELGPAVLSPDGQTIVFSVLSKADSRLYKVRTDGTDFLPITIVQTWAYDPAFSPNGTKILFVQASSRNGDICEIKIDGSDKTCLTSGPDHDYSPVYSPDGSKIYFLRAKIFTNYSPVALPAWHNVDIYSMNVDGTAITKITSERSYGMDSLSISPQGEALLTMGPVSVDAIWIISLADPANKKSIRPNLDKYRKKILWIDKDVDYQSLRNPQFSPDGRKILFSWPYHDELYVMDRETNLAEQIWKSKSNENRWPSRMYPRYSLDGQRIIFSTATSVEVSICDSDRTPFNTRREIPELWIINSDGTGLQSVAVKSEGQ
jgi:Tol biopolymer transport system component